MKLLNRIKYRLFRWLMDDICMHSGVNGTCDGCKMNQPYEDGGFIYPCLQNHVFVQAYRVWMWDLKEE